MGFMGNFMHGYMMNVQMINSMVDNARTKKDIKRISKQIFDSNVISRNVTIMPYVNKEQLLLVSSDENDIYIFDTQSTTPAIDFIWGEDDIPENTVVSGGDVGKRANAFMPFIRQAQLSGIPVIVLYDGNKDLENVVLQNSIFVEKIGSKDYFYDLFRGLPGEDAAEIIYKAMPEGTKTAAEALLRSLINIVLLKYGTVNFELLANYPITNFIVELDKFKENRSLNDEEYSKYSNDYMMGTSEISDVASFLRRLKRQMESLFGTSNISNGCNIKRTINQKAVELLDIGQGNNEIAIKTILQHLIYLQEIGKKFALVVDGIPIGLYDELSVLFRTSKFAVGTNDFISSLFGGGNNGEDLFSEIMGAVTNIVLFKHDSGSSCQKWSDHIGKYRKMKMRMSLSQSNNILMNNNSRGIQVEETDEPKVRAESLALLPESMACIYRKGEILIANI